MAQRSRSSPFILKWKKKLQYLSDHCSLQVLGYIFTPSHSSLFKRIFWLVTILVCGVCSVIVLQGALTNYTSDAISYSVETNYLDFDTPFPAVTICDYWASGDNKIVAKYFNASTIPEGLQNFARDVSFWYPYFCKNCLGCQEGRTCIRNFSDLVKFIRKQCKLLLVRCSWNGEPFSCCERFLPIETEYGTCFVFNSRLTDNNKIYTVNRKVGLHTLAFEAMANVMVRPHSPDELLSVASDKVLSKCESLPLVSEMDLTLSAEETVNDLSVQRLSPSNRDCLFENEQPAFAHLWPFKQYSYGACLMYCRAMTQIEACNCTHHFMPKIGNYPKCGIEGLVCFRERKVLDRMGVNSCNNNCSRPCEEVTYKTIYVTCPRPTHKLSEDISHNGTGTRGRIRLARLPTLRVRRHAIRELLGLVVDVGGVIGVFFGASLLSFIEIYYLLFIRKYH